MISRLLTTPCTITTRGADFAVDDHGNKVWSDEDTTETVCHVNEQNTREDEAPEQFTDTLARIYLLPTETIGDRDLITVDGREWEVQGAPTQRRRAPGGGAIHHLEVACREVV